MHAIKAYSGSTDTTVWARISVHGIASHYRLDGQEIVSQWGRDFLRPSRLAHPTFYTVVTGTFPGVKRLKCGYDHPLPPSTKVKERVEVHLYSLSGPLWPVLGQNITIPFTGITVPNINPDTREMSSQFHTLDDLSLGKKHPVLTGQETVWTHA